MDDAQLVAVVRRRQDLLHHVGDVAFRHRLFEYLVVVQYPRKQIAALAKLCHDVDIAIRHALLLDLLEVHLMHLHDVWVVQRLQQLDLGVDQVTLHRRLGHHLAGSQLLGDAVPNDHYLPEGADADVAEELVVVEDCQTPDVCREHHLGVDLRGS